MRKPDLPGFHYDEKRRRVVLDGYVPCTKPKVRRQKTIDNVTKDQALDAYKAFRADLASGRAIVGPLTLRQFVDNYFELIAKPLAEGTKKTQLVIINAHLLRYFGDEELSKITAIRVEDFKADMRERKREGSYINDAVRVLKKLLRQAAERGVIAEYPIRRRIEKEREKVLRQELDRDERIRFFAAFENENEFRARIAAHRVDGPEKTSVHFENARRFGGGMRDDSEAAGRFFERFRELRDYFIVAVETGLRVFTDLRNLQWSSVHFGSGFIRVRMQKTSAEAEVPLSRACAEALRRCQSRSVASIFVFVDGDGNRFSPTRIRRMFVLAKELAGITRPFRLHDLRHTFGCRLADGNISLPKIAKALGHKSTRMAERYAKPSAEAMREIAFVLDDDAVTQADPSRGRTRAFADTAERS